MATLRIRLRDGSIVSRDVEHHGDAAVVLPYDPSRCCALVARLFRGPVFDATGVEELEEACAGMIESEEADAAARREAAEELGVSLRELEWVARVWPCPSVSSERQALYLASIVLKIEQARAAGSPRNTKILPSWSDRYLLSPQTRDRAALRMASCWP